MTETIKELSLRLVKEHAGPTVEEFITQQLIVFCAQVANDEACPYTIEALAQGFAALQEQENKLTKELANTPTVSFGVKK